MIIFPVETASENLILGGSFILLYILGFIHFFSVKRKINPPKETTIFFPKPHTLYFSLTDDEDSITHAQEQTKNIFFCLKKK
jgi:hypothetical protein